MFQLAMKSCCLLLCLSLIGCTINDAKPSKNQYLIIASDCLTQQDTNLFEGFEKRNGIRVYILHLTLDKIIEKISKESYATRIDAVLLSSLYDADKMNRLKLFQRINTDEDQSYNDFFSNERTYFGFGYNPYVIIPLLDSLVKIENYNGLAQKEAWCSDLDSESESEWYPFYASMTAKSNAEKSFNWSRWMHDFLANKEETPSPKDSLLSCSYYFTLFSHLDDKKSNRAFLKKREIIFPNQTISGSYANMPTYGIIRQAANFYNATLFLKYLQTDLGNKTMNEGLGTFPLKSSLNSKYTFRQQNFDIHDVPATRVIDQFERVKTLLKAAKKIKAVQVSDPETVADTIQVE